MVKAEHTLVLHDAVRAWRCFSWHVCWCAVGIWPHQPSCWLLTVPTLTTNYQGSSWMPSSLLAMRPSSMLRLAGSLVNYWEAERVAACFWLRYRNSARIQTCCQSVRISSVYLMRLIVRRPTWSRTWRLRKRALNAVMVLPNICTTRCLMLLMLALRVRLSMPLSMCLAMWRIATRWQNR